MSTKKIDKIRLLLFADSEAVHTRRWANWFSLNGLDVQVLSFNSIVTSGFSDVSIKILWTSKFKFKFGIRFIKALVILLRTTAAFYKFKPHVIHGHSCGSYSWITLFFRKTPKVITPWGTDILIDINTSLFNRILTEKSLKYADLVTTDAEHMRPQLEILIGKSNKILYLPFGTDTSIFRPKRNKSSSSYINIISTRTLNKVHDVKLLIEAIPILLNIDSRFRFTVVGSGSEFNLLLARCKELKILDSVTFTGNVSELVMANLLASSDIYVSTSPFDAGLAASTAEAMAVGLPIVHPDTADNRSWIGYEGAEYFPPYSQSEFIKAVTRVLDRQKKWSVMGKHNRKIIVEKNNLDKNMNTMLDHYNLLAKIK
jgi:glycosyltransferase involved in cell wall biosynthesis